MNKKINILVDGAGGDVGQGVLKSLLDSTLDLELYASCISTSSSWLYKIEKSFLFPLVSDENFIAFLINFLNKYKIDVYFPTVDSALIKIAQYKTEIETRTNTKVCIASLDKIAICDDKYLTNQFLLEHGFEVPQTFSMDGVGIEVFLSKNSFPLILKTKSGNGAKNVLKIENYESLRPFIGNSQWLLQEYLDISHEVTSGIYRGEDSEVKGIYTLKRTLKCGSTYHAQRVIDKVLEKKLLEIAEIMEMKYLNIQAIYKEGRLLPFEFNGRLSGTTGAMRSVFNVPEMYIQEIILSELIDPCDNQEEFFFTRYNEEVIYTQAQIDALIKRSHLS